MWKSGIPGGHHDHPRKNRASCRTNTPVVVVAVNTRGLNPEPRLEAMVHRVPLQVLNELVACHPTAEVTWNPVAGEMRQRANGVQVETVIAAAPRLPHTTTLDDGGVYAARPNCRRSRQASRTSADNDDILHSPTLPPAALYAAQAAS
jgi:hypothetical protein